MEFLIHLLFPIFLSLSNDLSEAQNRSAEVTLELNMEQISVALEVYFINYGQYPGTLGLVECFEDGSSIYEALIGSYLGENYYSETLSEEIKNSTITVNGKTCKGSIAYAPLVANNAEKHGYMLAVDVELYENANFTINKISEPGSITKQTTVEQIKEWISEPDLDQLQTGETSDSGNNVLLITMP